MWGSLHDSFVDITEPRLQICWWFPSHPGSGVSTFHQPGKLLSCHPKLSGTIGKSTSHVLYFQVSVPTKETVREQSQSQSYKLTLGLTAAWTPCINKWYGPSFKVTSRKVKNKKQSRPETHKSHENMKLLKSDFLWKARKETWSPDTCAPPASTSEP